MKKLLFLVLLLTSCSSVAPSEINRVQEEETWYHNAEGTPFAYAKIWNHGKVNIWTEIQVIKESPGRHCVFWESVVWGGHTTGKGWNVRPVTSSELDSLYSISGSVVQVAGTDTLRGDLLLLINSPCGAINVVYPITLVKD